MQIERSGVSKTLVTLRTGIWLFSSMSHYMLIEATGPDKTSVTLRT